MDKDHKKGEYIFTTTDPLGRKVILKSDTWNIHVLDGHNYRPELIGQEEQVKAIIEDPRFIIPDPIENRVRYFDIVHLTSIEKIKPVMVVVEHSSSDTGDVCTVVTQSRMRDTTKGGIIYDRSRRES